MTGEMILLGKLKGLISLGTLLLFFRSGTRIIPSYVKEPLIKILPRYIIVGG